MLEEIGGGSAPRLLVYNKADLLDPAAANELTIRDPGSIAVSALAGDGLETLRDRIESTFEETLSPLELLLPYSEGGVLAELHELAGDLDREDRPDGVLVRARVPTALTHRFADFAVNGAGATGDGQGER